MRTAILANLAMLCVLVFTVNAKAEKLAIHLPISTKSCCSASAVVVDRVFSGTVSNENGDNYNYYFQMQRKNTNFHAIAFLIDSQTKKVLLFEESFTTITHAQIYNWQVGRHFLQFNPITDSWVFGVKSEAKNGFNFKVDLLNFPKINSSDQISKDGVVFFVTQAAHLNGHLQTGLENKEQFVTARRTWFKQIIVDKRLEVPRQKTVLCQFNDGSGIYSIIFDTKDKMKVAGRVNRDGLPIAISQFVSINKTNNGIWHIKSPYSQLDLVLKDVLMHKESKYPLIAGLTKGIMPGFCAISML